MWGLLAAEGGVLAADVGGHLQLMGGFAADGEYLKLMGGGGGVLVADVGGTCS